MSHRKFDLCKDNQLIVFVIKTPSWRFKFCNICPAMFFFHRYSTLWYGLVSKIQCVIPVLEISLWMLTVSIHSTTQPFTDAATYRRDAYVADVPDYQKQSLNSQLHTSLNLQLPLNLLKMSTPGLYAGGHCVHGVEWVSEACVLQAAPLGAWFLRLPGTLWGTPSKVSLVKWLDESWRDWTLGYRGTLACHQLAPPWQNYPSFLSALRVILRVEKSWSGAWTFFHMYVWNLQGFDVITKGKQLGLLSKFS